VAKEKKYLFGPVPSRRLGLSLGVDVVPFKVCTLDCIYCQLAKTTHRTIERKDYVPVESVLAELKDNLAQAIKADFITISGSGEPTLNSRLGELIDGIKKLTSIPVAILTNGTLLYRQDVRADCCCADVVLPSLDAADEQTFQKINRPHPELSIKKLIEGLCTFRDEYAGQIALEVFLIDGFNTDTEQIAKIKDGVKASLVDQAARRIIENKGWGKYFGHGLGHGIGMAVHEEPAINPKSHAILKEGMVVTIEPGIYFPNRFGLRREDMVLVKKNSAEVLSGDVD